MSDVSTISEFIEDYENIDITYNKMHYKESNIFESGERVILLSDSILTKYKKDLDEIVTMKTLTDKEESKYFYNPQYLSYDLYGSTQYWHLLLEINNMYSAIEFTHNPLKVFNGSLPTLIENILSLEEESINLNNEEIEDSILSIEEDDDESDNVYEEE